MSVQNVDIFATAVLGFDFETVQLLHTLPDGSSHIDWMIATTQMGGGREGSLLTFRLDRSLEDLRADFGSEPITISRIDDHRPHYLHYEGPISDNRGEVSRLTSGIAGVADITATALHLRIGWSRPTHVPRVFFHVELRYPPQGSSEWTLLCTGTNRQVDT